MHCKVLFLRLFVLKKKSLNTKFPIVINYLKEKKYMVTQKNKQPYTLKLSYITSLGVHKLIHHFSKKHSNYPHEQDQLVQLFVHRSHQSFQLVQ